VSKRRPGAAAERDTAVGCSNAAAAAAAADASMLMQGSAIMAILPEVSQLSMDDRRFATGAARRRYDQGSNGAAAEQNCHERHKRSETSQ
jgi:hypothetical protein